MSGQAVIFRADSSLEIGTGHVMRCLTLADTLREHGVASTFVCRSDAGHLIERVRLRGHAALPLGTSFDVGCEEDARRTLAALEDNPASWVVVDHYTLDARWERAVRGTRKVMVIDDLANREHDCELLLDQNLGRTLRDYDGLVPATTRILAGPEFALLRPEFAQLRPYSLSRRKSGSAIGRVLVTMGGIDQHNMTGTVLEALSEWHPSCPFSVVAVLGPSAPWIDSVKALAGRLPFETEVVVDAQNMAKLMADADVAIGAAGSTAWERCCLGLPTITLVLAENQRGGAEALAAAGAIIQLTSTGSTLTVELRANLGRIARGDRLCEMSAAAAQITDGTGCARVAAEMLRGE